MKNSKILKAYLILSGLLLTFIGGATLFMPVVMKASGGIDIADSVNAINDVRAYSALLLASALLALFGVFNKGLTYTSTLVTVLVFLSLGAGRLLSILQDGMPADGLVKATILEFVLGTIGAILFSIYRTKK
ncbi:DUF4345 domain-containing protein [bacterium SCSIO 12741]|nr:DUF4345 domain-containing protein [bacterium SCSIO 12741]